MASDPYLAGIRFRFIAGPCMRDPLGFRHALNSRQVQQLTRDPRIGPCRSY